MYFKCENNCIRAIIKLREESIFQIIKDFCKNLDFSRTQNFTIESFYKYIEKKYKINCEIGMLFVEKLIMAEIYDKFFAVNNVVNLFINNKLELYQWIKPKHLEITSPVSDHIVKQFKKISLYCIPSVKLNYFMKAVKALYKFIGKNKSQNEFFSCLVFYLIKAQIKDLYFHIMLINLFQRKYLNLCGIDCNHGFKISIFCSCMKREDWKDEENYYLTTANAAIEFIMRIEFYDLNITSVEFNKEIEQKLNNLKITKKIN